MRFDVSDNNDIIILKDKNNNTQVEIYTFGALLNKFEIEHNDKKHNVIDAYTSVDDARKNITQLHKSAKLTPFVCRLNQGKFSYKGVPFEIKKFNIGASAIHGLVFDAEFKKSATHADDKKATATLHYDYNTPEHGFPFAFGVTVAYKLEADNKLSVETSISNKGAASFPLSDGWHPYFKLGETINTAEIKFNAKDTAEFSPELLPTGQFFDYDEFASFTLMGDKELDNSFRLKGFDTPAFSMKDKQAGLQLDIMPDASYPILQIYTPPHRKSIAVENLSSVPDAFNNKIGLIEIAPGATENFKTTYQVSAI